MFNFQTTFNTIAAHLLLQGVQAKNSAGDCMYRGPNGTKCALGVIIPDEKYSADFEGGAVTSCKLIPFVNDLLGTSFEAVESGKTLFGKLVPQALKDRAEVQFLGALQEVHDNDTYWFRLDDMKNALRNVAQQFSVDPAILDTAPVSDNWAEHDKTWPHDDEI